MPMVNVLFNPDLTLVKFGYTVERPQWLDPDRGLKDPDGLA